MASSLEGTPQGNYILQDKLVEILPGSFSDRGSTPLCSTRIRSVELGFNRNMFALAIEIEVNR